VLLLLVGAVAAAIVASAALAVIDALRISREVSAGRAAFSALIREGLSSEAKLTGRARNAAARFSTAEARASSSVWIGGWARVPLLGQPARWLRGATRATSFLGRRASEVVARLEPRLEAGHLPAQRLQLLDTMKTEFDTLLADVEGIRIPSSGWFLPPVNAADREMRSELVRLRSALEDGAAAARGLRSMLGGPSSYLILASNNAEMRAGGMILQAGLIRLNGGQMQAGRFSSTARLTLKRPVALPGEIRTLYGWLRPDLEWRNLGSSPNFPATAPVYASMAARKRFGRVDGVMQIDVLGVKALLGVVGAVDVDGRRYTSKNVEELVLHDLYASFGPAQVERQQEFSKLAAATFQALNGRGWRPGDLARALRKAIRGRHMLAWSTRPAEQTAFRRMHMDGALERDGLMVTVQNHGGNKLDWFLRPSLEARISDAPRGGHRITLTISIANPTPADESKYVAGDGSLVPVGDYRALVAVYLPGWATSVRVPGRSVALVGPDGPSRVIGTRVDIARGATVTLTVQFTAPPEADRLVLVPSGRARPVPVRIGSQRSDDAATRVFAI
jgi:hypothetical protein